MPSISKIRFTNVVYEDGMKRYNNEIFKFDGFNGAILLENGGGKTVFIQTALQAIIPHTNLSDRKIKQTLQLDNYPAHIAIEWIITEQPRRYLVTAVSLFLTKDGLGSYRYVYPYQAGDRHRIEEIPFVRKDSNRPADRGEIADYYQQMAQQHMNAHTFSTIKDFQQHIEEQYHIIANEWDAIVKINSTEGGVEAFFDECKQTNQLFDRLLIPTVESAIAGHHEHTFADTFEKHRASFKLYKELKEQIEENKSIEEQLNRYVATFEHLHDRQQAYEHKKQRAKAVLNLIHLQEKEHEAKLLALEEKRNTANLELRELQESEQSLNIQIEQSKLTDLKVELQEYTSLLELSKNDFTHAKKSFYSLKLAEQKQAHKVEHDRLRSLQDQLEALEQEEDFQELSDRFTENSEQLNGYFTNELEESKKRQNGLKIEKQPLTDGITEAETHRKTLRQQLEQTKGIFNKNVGKIDSLEMQMDRIRHKILAKPDQEAVDDFVGQWEKRLVYLDEQIVYLKTENKQLQGKIKDLNGQHDTIKSLIAENELKRTEIDMEVKQAEQAHLKMIEELGSLRPQWTSLDSVYLKEDSLTQQVADSLERLKKERNDCLYKERLAHRFIDDYGSQDIFFADPFVEQQIKQWSNQFHLLETGSQFIQGLEGSHLEQAKNYPLWPITLITTEVEQAQLKEKIIHVNKRLQFPIDVLSIEQARAIVQGEYQSTLTITPAHWLENQQVTSFQQWKLTMKERAETASQARVEVETKLDSWKRVLEKLANFFVDYPYHKQQERKEQLTSIAKAVHDLGVEQQEIAASIEASGQLLTTQQERIDTFEKEYQGLQTKLDLGYDYLSFSKETKQLKKTQDMLSEQLTEIDRIIKKQELHIRRLSDEKDRIEEHERDERYYFNSLIDDPLYNEVKKERTTFTDKELDILKEEREELKLSLRKLSTTRNELIIKLEHSQKEINRLNKVIEELINDYGPLDEQLSFPPNGTEQITLLRERIRQLEKQVDEITENYHRANEEKLKQEKVVELALDQFHQQFAHEKPKIFNEPLSDVREQLKLENQKVLAKFEYLDREKARTDKGLNSIRTAFHELDRYEEAHHFKGPSVQADMLSDGEIQDFSYERINFVKTVTTALKQAKALVSKEQEKVEHAKEMFKAFCKTKITNVKMQKMARDGIETKRTYKEVIEFQANMQKRIQTAIKYNETSIIDHDKQLEQFVTHINSHLYTIAGELELIPKKTKVKVEDKWKEIYKFTIPEWTEEDGKSRIRKHIEWILEQLESERFKSEDGVEDYGKVRKEIETWIQSKQLLRVVMNNETMKITCRKVTNDNEVTTRSYSWEQSNVWSGGEKWSKNMTLFLGILNYVSEKKHVDSRMKRNRVVILDNPFGKASSDHVLNPVFFIAEQLGFQIIALTAHAEGKFLRDYFPVIYSCRLRKAADSNKQIMTKVKQLHQAYFQDHEPQALERLGEMKQMELF
ncbi:hypothetical protein [Metabacillus malikii]|uniref:Chromosome segregation ATPase n=1 Tax=Metabacillus malikii TaxID=1504265 RepID=A0ABT9Z9U7_9BACI|nr:hypothetical protein [Metabacillus malikii]MDQ0229017.1 chromosome segregation ATPase [Metabacillus malikii]